MEIYMQEVPIWKIGAGVYHAIFRINLSKMCNNIQPAYAFSQVYLLTAFLLKGFCIERIVTENNNHLSNYLSRFGNKPKLVQLGLNVSKDAQKSL